MTVTANMLGITATIARFWNRFSVDFQDQIFTCINFNLNHERSNELQHGIPFGSLQLLRRNTLVHTIGIIVTVARF